MARTSASNRGARDYSDVPVPSTPRSRFDRSYSHHTAFNSGVLVPIDREELLPNDTYSVRPTVFARLTTLALPIFSNIFVDIHYFAVSLRHIWENSEEFFGAEPGGPGTRVDRLTPKLDLSAGIGPETLHDYLGIPPGVAVADSDFYPHNLYGRAYNFIWNEWYRDAEIQALIPLDTDDGPDNPGQYTLQRRNKQRDRFTSARPWPYKGPDVNLPLGASAPVVSSGSGVPTFSYPGGPGSLDALAGIGNPNFSVLPNAGITPISWSTTSLAADLSAATGASVGDFRTSLALQHLFEQFARGGSARYTELVHNVWGVRNPDMRVQRPEFIGGVTAKVMVNPVANTQNIGFGGADLYAYAVGVKTGNRLTYTATEHMVVLGIASIRTEYLYSQGIDKELTRDSRFDYAWPQFMGLSEQPIYSQELFWQGTAADRDVFGYEPRYQEYRERMNRVSGKMRPDAAGTLAGWHLGQDFSGQQLLNSSFIEERPPFDRVTVLTEAEEPSFKVDVYLEETMIRPITAYGTPGLMRL